jgi:hypothetical protein
MRLYLLPQIEFRDMRYGLVSALLTTDDAESAAKAEEGLDCVRKLLEKNYDLYAGRNGVPPIRSMNVELVRTNARTLSSSPTPHPQLSTASTAIATPNPPFVLAISLVGCIPPIECAPCRPCFGYSLALQKNVMLVDACPATHDPAGCGAVYSGILNRGLFAAVESFVHLYIELMETRGLAHGNHTVVQVSSVCNGVRG